MVTEDTFHRPVVFDNDLIFSKSTYSLGHSNSKCADGDCKSLCDILISQVYNSTSVDAALSSPSAPVHYAMDRSVPRGSTRKIKHTSWFYAFFKILRT